MNIQNLIPKDKGDVETAEKLFSYSYSEIESIIPELLGWMMDGNWPVARPVGDFLVSISHDIIPQIFEVLEGNDMEWKYFLIWRFGLEKNEEIHPKLLIEIERIANNPTQIEIVCSLQEIAIWCLEE